MKEKTKNKPKRAYKRKEGSRPPGNPELKPRQSKYKTAEELKIKIDAYFKECDKKKIPYTVTGLALALDLTSRQAVLDYEKEDKHKDLDEGEKKLIIDTIKKAKMKIERFLEVNLIEGRQVAGTIFNLKNNYGYIDRQDLAVKGDIIVNIKGVTKF